MDVNSGVLDAEIRHPADLRASTIRILLSSLIGTTVEFYDFYIFATAASLVFGPLFFPSVGPANELLGAYASFGFAFIARPIGGALFGHFGDRIGRKATLFAALALMGLSSFAIGVLPTYAMVGNTAPVLLCVLRFGQGLALGGEWTGAVLLALENAPPGWRARYAMFAPLGAPFGFLLANGLFLIMAITLTQQQFLEWGWRIPFLASIPLVWLGLWVRFNLVETPEFAAALAEAKPARVPLVEVVRHHLGKLLVGALGVVACFSLYYIVTAFVLGYGTHALGYSRPVFLSVELAAIGFMALGILLACWFSDRFNAEIILIAGCVGTILVGTLLPVMLGSGSLWIIFSFLALSLFIMGFVNGPLGAWLPGLFPARVRYSGTSLAFNLGGIVGGAFSPIAAQLLADRSGLAAVGFYLALTAGFSLLAFEISARRRAVKTIAQSEKRYRSIFEQNHVCLLELDVSELREAIDDLQALPFSSSDQSLTSTRDTLSRAASHIRFVDANEAAAKLLGCDSLGGVLRPIAEFLPADSNLLEEVVERVRSGQHHLEREIHMMTADGRRITVLVIIGFPATDQAFDRVACAMLDVTKREEAKETLLAARMELARAARVATIGAVSASIAHEVNQPIGAVVMFASACIRWLKAEPPDIAAALSAADRAAQHAMRASQIVQRTKAQVKGADQHVEPTDPVVLVNEVLVLLEREIAQAQVRVVTAFDPSVNFFMSDRVEMQQVIANLITNALHAMASTPAADREVQITVATAPADQVRLTVKDSGTGIKPEDLPNLFSTFFTTKVDGIGIGLSICKTIVEKHGGSMSAANAEPRGAIFEIVIPMIREE